MSKWIIAIIFIIVFPFAAFADDNTVMQTWIQQKFGILIPDPKISQDWKSMPMINGCDYEWSVQWKDAIFQVKDQNENYYRVYYQNDRLTLDFKRAFNEFFGS
jgi:hypothetical protein